MAYGDLKPSQVAAALAQGAQGGGASPDIISAFLSFLSSMQHGGQGRMPFDPSFYGGQQPPQMPPSPLGRGPQGQGPGMNMPNLPPSPFAAAAKQRSLPDLSPTFQNVPFNSMTPVHRGAAPFVGPQQAQGNPLADAVDNGGRPAAQWDPEMTSPQEPLDSQQFSGGAALGQSPMNAQMLQNAQQQPGAQDLVSLIAKLFHRGGMNTQR